MKRIIYLLILITFSIKSFSQEKLLDILPIENGNVVYTEVIKVENINKKELYNRAKKWVVLKYKSANDVIQLDDKEDGIIIGKGNFGIKYYSRKPTIEHTIQIETKDGRYKYTVSSFIYSDVQNDTFTIEKFPKSWFGKKKLYKTLDEKVNSIIADLKKFMKTELKDDW
ncbi:DUF4468 domain-containing protein [Wenyingzhuangia sp. IMCC45574]